ncbi:MAG: hypothetical protein ACNA78_01810 [Balneolaceae bacterium]
MSFDGESVRAALVQSSGGKLKVVQVDKLKLATPVLSEIRNKEEKPDFDFTESDSSEKEKEELDESIFGFDDDSDSGSEDDVLGEIDLSDLDDDLDDFESLGDIDEGKEFDLAEQASSASTNEMMIYEYLESLKQSKKVLAVNISSGSAVFQIEKEGDYKSLKKKEIQELVTNKLHAIYGELPDSDFYDYYVREDNALIIGSVDKPSPMLHMVVDAKAQFNKNYYVQDVVADESVMVSMFKNHYEITPGEITGLLQIGPNRSRMLFLSGGDTLQISPVINEGTNHKSYLNTIFSKILFQLDTGEIPGLDRLIVFNNTEGNKVLDFFRTSFSDLRVENFNFLDSKVEVDEKIKSSADAFTTAIGLAMVAAKSDVAKHINLSFIPKHVIEGQKVFRLQWYGYVLLFLIGISPLVINHLHQKNTAIIESLEARSNQLTMQIENVEPYVLQVENLVEQLAMMEDQLDILQNLSEENIKWTVTKDAINRAVQNTGGLWLNSFRQNDNVLMVDGYSLTRQNIPTLASQFHNVTLLNVRKQEIRDREIFFFTMMIRDVIDDRALFTPESAREIREFRY